jgi:uncharacterized phiE125 gp8 family phage protein
VLEKITAPTEYPVTLAEIKRHLRVTIDDDDSLLEDYLAAATEYCEDQVTGSRSFMTQTWDWKLHVFPGDSFEIPRPPLQSVSSIKYFATDSSTGVTTLSSTNYLVHLQESLPGVVELHPEVGSWPTVADRADAVQVRFISGGSGAPQQVKQAVKLLVGHWYAVREDVAVVGSEIPHGVRSLLTSVGYGSYS